ncbi:GldM family protein [uncultured Psychroserpens sp.]|uniref:GldM family protein n=1 Tax=uncultured Psychroserpens sp. TaxID=255436 RepID=UPI00261C3385|nr:GldM family protein [uncultured Psychroserpens sp.]
MTKFLFLLLVVQITFAQEVSLEMSLQNIVVKGIYNPVEVIIEDTKCTDVIIKSDDAKLIQSEINPCSYNLITNTDHRELTISFFKKKQKDTVFVTKRTYRVIDFPDPIPTLAGIEEGEVSEEKFKKYFSIGKFGAYSEYACIDFNITSYTMMVVRDTTSIGISKNVGNRASEETKKLIALVKSGDQVYITNLECKVLDQVRRLDEIRFDIK